MNYISVTKQREIWKRAIQIEISRVLIEVNNTHSPLVAKKDIPTKFRQKGSKQLFLQKPGHIAV